MSARTITGIILGTLAFFLGQLLCLYRVPSWGWDSPFPFTILRSVELPILVAVTAGVGAALSGSAAQRKLLYPIVVASLVEIATIEIMVSFSKPALVLAVLFLNAVVATQFVRYAAELFRVD